jgi:hypothetical protein
MRTVATRENSSRRRWTEDGTTPGRGRDSSTTDSRARARVETSLDPIYGATHVRSHSTSRTVCAYHPLHCVYLAVDVAVLCGEK